MSKTLIINLLYVLLFLSFDANSQTQKEKLGAATAGYWGSVITMRILSESKCRNSTSITLESHNLQAQKQMIISKVKPYLNHKELKELPAVLQDIEKDLRDFFNNTIKLDSVATGKCDQLVREFQAIHDKHKRDWDSLVR